MAFAQQHRPMGTARGRRLLLAAALLAALILAWWAPAGRAHAHPAWSQRPIAAPQMAGGADHTLFLQPDGTVWAVGRNDNGQLGDGTTTHRDTPVQVTTAGGDPLTDVVAVAAGFHHSLALRADGTVWTWGDNWYGQLGDGTDTNRHRPVQVVTASGAPLTDVVAIAAGGNHSLAVKRDGTLWAWGKNQFDGQLGNNNNVDQYRPVQVITASGDPFTDVVAVAGGANHTLALRADGTLWAWGNNREGQLGNDQPTDENFRAMTPVPVTTAAGDPFTNVVAVAAGYDHSLALRADGTLWAWGQNNSGQLGNGTISDQPTWWPVQVVTDSGAPLTGVVAVTAGTGYHSLALQADGTLWAWGHNFYGQLGDGTAENDRTTALPVTTGTGNPLADVVAVAAGGYHSLALRADGTLWVWGDNEYAQLGAFRPREVLPVPPELDRNTHTLQMIAAGNRHSLAVQTDGTAWAWGYNGEGQLGDGTTTNRDIPRRLNDLDHVVALAGGEGHSVALRADGTVWAWGNNTFGQLGDGSTDRSDTPVQVTGLTGVAAVAAGDNHSVALRADGTLWAWGLGTFGQLGAGDNNDASTPVQVTTDGTTPLTHVTAVAAGAHHTLALRADGTVWTWGENGSGQLGTGDTVNTNTAVQVTTDGTTPLSGIVAVAAADTVSLAVQVDGTLWAWGQNEWTEVGNSRTRPLPMTLDGTTPLTGVVSAVAGYGHILALRETTTWAWGYNDRGQLGDGTTTAHTHPAQVPNATTPLTGVKALAAGMSRSLALLTDGTVRAWGSNIYGQLGDDTQMDRHTPVAVAFDFMPPDPPAITTPQYVNWAGQDAVTISGTAEALAAVTLAVDDNDGNTEAVTATTTADGTDGSWSFTLDLSALSDGTLTAAAIATDEAGNISAAGTATTIKDTVVNPPVIALPTWVNAADQGNAAVGGTAEAGATVSLAVDDNDGGTAAITGTATAAADGSWSLTLDLSTLADGSLTATGTATDLAGNTSTDGTATATKDTVAPAAPVLNPLPTWVNAADQSKVTVSGTAEAGSTVSLSVDDNDGGTAAVTDTTTADDGTWSITLDLSSLTDGTLTANATATDPAGNTSAASTATTTMDTTAPPAPALAPLPDWVNADDQSNITISGTAEAGSTVSLSVDDNDGGTAAVAAITTAAGDGSWSMTFDLSSLADGTLTATATATDVAGNTSTAGTETTTKDTVVDPPVIVLPTWVSAADQSNVTVSGTTEAGATVSLAVDDNDSGTAAVTAITPSADGDGNWSIILDLTSLRDGTLAATATATDPAGNTSAAGTASTTKDTLAPAAPALAPLPVWVNAADQSALTISGTAEAGSSVNLSVDDNDGGTAAVTDTTTAAGNGSWSIILDLSTLADGTLTAAATATDPADNTSAAATDTTAKDTLAPAAPAITLPTWVNAAEQSRVTVGGTAEAGSTVSLSVDDTDGGTAAVSGTAIAAGDGTWSITLDLSALADGPLAVTASATDPAGNTSTAGTAATFKDTAAPAAPGFILPDWIALANESAAMVTGAAEPGATVSLAVADTAGGTVTGSAIAANDGTWSITLDLSALADGPLTATATASDAAGNTSPADTETTFKDTAAPAVPGFVLPEWIALANETAAAITGAAEPGATVSLAVADTAGETVTDSATAANDGTWSLTLDLSVLADGPLTATATASDPAGNTSGEATETTFKDTAAPAAPGFVLPEWIALANETAAAIMGAAEPGATVSLAVADTTGETVTDSATAANDGTWSITLDLSPLADGPLTATATAADAAGNNSDEATETTFKDTAEPAAPGFVLPDWIALANETAAAIMGAAEPGATVSLAVADTAGETVTDSATAANDGTWSLTLDLSTLADGPLTATATAADPAGNTSPADTETTFKDTAAPAAPGLVLPEWIALANERAAAIIGAAEPGATVSLTVADTAGGTVMGSATAANDGTWSITLDLSPLADGPLTATATASDPAGNTSQAVTERATKDTSAPAVPVVAPLPTWITQVNQAAVTVTGTAEAGSTISLAVDDSDAGTATATDTAIAAGDGSWSITLDLSPLADGPLTATVTAADAAGNTSQAATATSIKDTTIAPPGISPPAINRTNHAAATINGTAEAGSTVSLSVDDTDAGTAAVAGTATAATDGSWSLTLDLSTLVDGPLTATATATDPAGNTSTAGTATTIKDTAAPTASLVINGGAATTRGRTVTLEITAADAGSGVAEMRLSTDGEDWTDWEAYATTRRFRLPGGNGQKTVHLQVRDAAGNLSAAVTSAIRLHIPERKEEPFPPETPPAEPSPTEPAPEQPPTTPTPQTQPVSLTVPVTLGTAPSTPLLLQGLLAGPPGSLTAGTVTREQLQAALAQAEQQLPPDTTAVPSHVMIPAQGETRAQAVVLAPGAVQVLAKHQASLEVRARGVRLAIPTELLTQMAAATPHARQVVSIEELPPPPDTATAAAATAVSTSASAATAAALEHGHPASPIYAITLATLHPDGSLERQSQFTVPLSLTLPYQPDAAPDPDLLAVFRISEDAGTRTGLQYVGGRADPDSSTITVARNHLSRYVVLTATAQYPDVPPSHWAHAHIQLMTLGGVVQGLPDGTFAPAQQVTRAEFATMLARALGFEPAAAEMARYADADPGAWYAGPLGGAVRAGLMTGDGAGRIRPHTPMTREEMAAALGRALVRYQDRALPDAATAEALLAPFADRQALTDSQAPVALAVEAGLIRGRSETELVPQGSMTRAEAVTVIRRLLDQLSSE